MTENIVGNKKMNSTDAFDAAAASIASKATYTGASTTVVGWILSSEFGVLAGIVLGTVGLLTNWWFQHRRDKREEAEHQRRMARMSSKPGDLN